MLAVLSSITPVFALIFLGHILQKKLIPEPSFWAYCDQLVYWVLMPALLFYHTSTIDFSGAVVKNYAIIILSGFALSVIISLVASTLFGFNPKVTSSVLQGSCRHNSFIVLAIAGKLFGAQGLALATLAMAILIPMTNLVVVSTMVALLRPASQKNLQQTLLKILKGLATNPILISILLGLTFSFFHGEKIIVLHDTAHLLGGGALPIILLVIGANTQLKKIPADILPIATASSIKLFIFPTILLLLSQALGLNTIETTVLVLFGTAPTAVSSYTLANQMGGDAKLMGSIITLQTLLSFLSISLFIGLLQA